MESNKYSLDTEFFSSLLRIIIDYKFFFNQIENEREPQFKFLWPYIILNLKIYEPIAINS